MAFPSRFPITHLSPPQQRRIFWSQMLERVSPAAELASAFGSIGLGGAWNTLAHQAAIPQPAGLAAQASWVWTWYARVCART